MHDKSRRARYPCKGTLCAAAYRPMNFARASGRAPQPVQRAIGCPRHAQRIWFTATLLGDAHHACGRARHTLGGIAIRMYTLPALGGLWLLPAARPPCRMHNAADSHRRGSRTSGRRDFACLSTLSLKGPSKLSLHSLQSRAPGTPPSSSHAPEGRRGLCAAVTKPSRLRYARLGPVPAGQVDRRKRVGDRNGCRKTLRFSADPLRAQHRRNSHANSMDCNFYGDVNQHSLVISIGAST